MGKISMIDKEQNLCQSQKYWNIPSFSLTATAIHKEHEGDEEEHVLCIWASGNRFFSCRIRNPA